MKQFYGQPCWVDPSRKLNGGGYPRIAFEGSHYNGTRAAYELFFGS